MLSGMDRGKAGSVSSFQTPSAAKRECPMCWDQLPWWHSGRKQQLQALPGWVSLENIEILSGIQNNDLGNKREANPKSHWLHTHKACFICPHRKMPLTRTPNISIKQRALNKIIQNVVVHNDSLDLAHIQLTRGSLEALCPGTSDLEMPQTRSQTSTNI